MYAKRPNGKFEVYRRPEEERAKNMGDKLVDYSIGIGVTVALAAVGASVYLFYDIERLIKRHSDNVPSAVVKTEPAPDLGSRVEMVIETQAGKEQREHNK